MEIWFILLLVLGPRRFHLAQTAHSAQFGGKFCQRSTGPLRPKHLQQNESYFHNLHIKLGLIELCDVSRHFYWSQTSNFFSVTTYLNVTGIIVYNFKFIYKMLPQHHAWYIFFFLHISNLLIAILQFCACILCCLHKKKINV